MLPTAHDPVIVKPSLANPNAVIEPSQFSTESASHRKLSPSALRREMIFLGF